MTSIDERAVALINQTPPLSFAVIGRMLGIDRQRVFYISKSNPACRQRRRENARLRLEEKMRLAGIRARQSNVVRETLLDEDWDTILDSIVDKKGNK